MTLAEAISKPEGTEFFSIEKFEIVSQTLPKTARNGEIFSVVNLKAGTKDCVLRLWGAAASFRLPTDTSTLHGTFIRNDYQGKGLTCHKLNEVEGAVPFTNDEVQGIAGKVSIADILKAGKRGAEWAERQDGCLKMQVAAFTMAATAKMNGHPDN